MKYLHVAVIPVAPTLFCHCWVIVCDSPSKFLSIVEVDVDVKMLNEKENWVGQG
jgi:hypothetical protein